jgi:hypothetical protein
MSTTDAAAATAGSGSPAYAAAGAAKAMMLTQSFVTLLMGLCSSRNSTVSFFSGHNARFDSMVERTIAFADSEVLKELRRNPKLLRNLMQHKAARECATSG